MTERTIFLAALDIDDPSERAAYVDRAWGPDAGLRGQVENLLKAHGQSGEFMDQPAPALVATIGQRDHGVRVSRQDRLGQSHGAVGEHVQPRPLLVGRGRPHHPGHGPLAHDVSRHAASLSA
jgi:hypothetical protein